jgi:hypothetical protein
MDPYHFINFPKDANAYDQQRDCKLRNCIIEAIAWYIQVLNSPDASRNERRIALRFVAHLVGDIHQPLHAGFAEDRRRQRCLRALHWQERKFALAVGHSIS